MFFKTALRLVAFVLVAGAMSEVCYPKANASPSQEKPVSASPVPSPPLEKTPVEKLLSGQVVKVSPNEILLKQQDRGNIVLHLLPTTTIWEGLWVKSIPVAVGDHINARVERRSEGVFDAQNIWINVVNLVGNISNVEKRADGLLLNMQNRFLGSVIVMIDPRTEVTIQKGKQATFGTNPVQLHKGEQVRIIGRRLRNGAVLAIKLLFE